MPDSKDVSTQEICSQSVKQPADAHLASKAQFHRLQQELQTPQQHARSYSGQKRRISQSSDLLLSTERSKQQRVTQRDLFRAEKEQSQPAQCSPTSALHQLHAASPQLTRPPLVDANIELSSPTLMLQQAIDTSLHSSPVACVLPMLQGRSAEVLHSRLSRCELLPEHTAAGRQLLELEAQLQSLVGARKLIMLMKFAGLTMACCCTQKGSNALPYPMVTLSVHRCYKACLRLYPDGAAAPTATTAQMNPISPFRPKQHQPASCAA
ncbi:TPA: hypothetical protein ACH3X1_012470 [Trebouxia sp. C0004]